MRTIALDLVRALARPCRDQSALIDREFDAPLSRTDRIGLRTHLVYCRSCARFKRQIRRLRAIASSIGMQSAVDDALPDAVRDRIESCIRSGGTRPGENES